MVDRVWYNRSTNLDNYGLLTQADNCDMYRSPLWGASVPLAIPISLSQEKGVAGERHEVTQIGLLCI